MKTLVKSALILPYLHENYLHQRRSSHPLSLLSHWPTCPRAQSWHIKNRQSSCSCSGRDWRGQRRGAPERLSISLITDVLMIDKIQEEAGKSAIIDGEKIGGNSDSFSLTALVQKEKKEKGCVWGRVKWYCCQLFTFLKKYFFSPTQGKESRQSRQQAILNPP